MEVEKKGGETVKQRRRPHLNYRLTFLAQGTTEIEMHRRMKE